MNADKFSILTNRRTPNLLLAVWRDRDLPSEADPDDWNVAVHVTAGEIGEVGTVAIQEDGYWLYWADPEGLGPPVWPRRR